MSASQPQPATGSGTLDGRTAVVTGAASGTGEATARAFAAEGTSVTVADINQEAPQALARKIGGKAWVADLSDTVAREQVSLHADILVNAGIQRIGPIHGLVASPFKSAYITAKHGLQGMSKVAVLEKIMLANSPIKRLVEPAEVASLVTWLASDAAGMVTGASYTMDGAWTAR